MVPILAPQLQFVFNRAFRNKFQCVTFCSRAQGLNQNPRGTPIFGLLWIMKNPHSDPAVLKIHHRVDLGELNPISASVSPNSS